MKPKSLFLLSLTLATAICSCNTVQQPYGHVYDSKTRLPLVGVSIHLQRHGDLIYTDKKGFFSFEKTTVGNDHLIFSFKGYQIDTLPALFNEHGESIHYNFQGDTIFMAPIEKAK